MLIALAFAHFSSKLIIPVKKTLHNVGHIDAKLIDFSAICQKKSSEIAVFYWLFLGEVTSRNFPRNRPIFLRILTFFPRNWPIFLQIFTLIPRKSREIGRFSPNLPLKIPRNFTFFAQNIRSPVYSVRGIFSHPWWCRWSEQFYKVLSVSQLTISSVKANNCYNV